MENPTNQPDRSDKSALVDFATRMAKRHLIAAHKVADLKTGMSHGCIDLESGRMFTLVFREVHSREELDAFAQKMDEELPNKVDVLYFHSKRSASNE